MTRTASMAAGDRRNIACACAMQINATALGLASSALACGVCRDATILHELRGLSAQLADQVAVLEAVMPSETAGPAWWERSMPQSQPGY